MCLAGAGGLRPGLYRRRAWLAGLVAVSRGNREISAELFICVRAASVHVAGRLSVASRGGGLPRPPAGSAGTEGPLIVCAGCRVPGTRRRCW